MASSRLTRRTLIKRAAVAGGVAVGATALAELLAGKDSATRRAPGPGAAGPPPNILVVIIDQMRAAQGFQAQALAAGLMPNLARLRSEGVSFGGHYTAANDCSPARGTMVTGLHSHQTGCLLTGGSTLSPLFPTYGTMLREQNYVTSWFGKWHLTSHDNQWSAAHDAHALEPYGFSGGTYPSPDGAPGEGWRTDPRIAAQFAAWYRTAPATRPWSATVSLVNPHDIAWWYRWTDQVRAESSAPARVRELPPNFETPADLIARGKPLLQLSLQQTAESGFGAVPFTGAEALARWSSFMDLYLKLLGEVDRHIGSVMSTLRSRPELAANTIVIFTSDHGEYGAAHGLRGKGAAVYEEGIKVPLIVADMRRQLSAAPSLGRTGLTSSVDLAPLLLTLATGSDAWRRDSHYAHLAARHDLAPMLTDPAAAGRAAVLHATDEILSEFATEPYAINAPLHVVAMRTPEAKYALYSHWDPLTDAVQSRGQERELYDYSTTGGAMELESTLSTGNLEGTLSEQLQSAIRDELHAQLPLRLQEAQRDGYADYHSTARETALVAASERRKLERDELPSKAVETLGAQ